MTSVAFGNMHLTRLLGGFLQQYPDIRVSLVLSDRYVDVVDEGFDVAIRLTSRPIESFVARRLAGIDYVICATPAYLKANAPIAVPDDLSTHNCVLNGIAPDAVRTFERDGERTAVQIRGRLTVNSSESVRVSVLDGAGVGLLPLFAVAEDVYAGRLEVILSDYSVEGAFGNRIYAIFAPGKFLAPKIRVFIDYLVATFGDGKPWERPIRG